MSTYDFAKQQNHCYNDSAPDANDKVPALNNIKVQGDYSNK